MTENTERFTVWTGGIEANSHHLTQAQAQALAAEYTAQGYEDVQIEQLSSTNEKRPAP